MRLLPILALALISTAAHARDSIRMDINISSVNTYAREGANSYSMRHSSGTVSGRISINANGQSASQEIPATTQSAPSTAGKIIILGANQIRILGADNTTTVDVKANIGRDGSIHAKGRHLSRAMEAMLEPQLRAIRAQLGSQARAAVEIRANDLDCAPKADGLECSIGARIAIAVSAN